MPEGQPTCDVLVTHPPRFWWLKRLMAGGILAAGLLAVGRWQWGQRVQGLVDAQIAAWKAAGEPVRAEDFAGPAVPDERNAAWFIVQAMQQYQPPPPDEQMAFTYFRGGRPEEAHAHLARNAAALRLLREARLRSEVSWRESFRGRLNQWPDAEDLAQLLRIAALVALHKGDGPAAIEHALDLFRMADALGERADAEAGRQAWQVLDEACGVAARIAFRMNRERLPASAGQLRQLADRLRDGRRTTEQLMRMLCAERMRALSDTDAHAVSLFATRGLQAPSPLQKAAGLAIRPAVQMQQLRSTRVIDRMIACLRANDLPGACAASIGPKWTASQRHYLYVVRRVESGTFDWRATDLVGRHNVLLAERVQVAASVDLLWRLAIAREWLIGLAATFQGPPAESPATRASGRGVPEHQDGEADQGVKPGEAHKGERRPDDEQ